MSYVSERVILSTLQMIRGTTYANHYRDLSALKRLAGAHGIAILLIHHLRKKKADDVFNRISETTAISGAVNASFTLVEEQLGSGRAPQLHRQGHQIPGTGAAPPRRHWVGGGGGQLQPLLFVYKSVCSFYSKNAMPGSINAILVAE